LINTYLTVVQKKNSNGANANIISLLNDNRQLRQLPVFYLTTNVGANNNKTSLAMDLIYPCPFKISREMNGKENIRQAFDEVVRIGIGERRTCTGLAWMIFESIQNATK
jgi:hypothetical protein